MTKELRTTLWILSSLAVLWTILALIGWFTMGGMMSGMGESARMGGGMHATMDGMMGGGMMTGMMVHRTLTWVVMLGLIGVFIYLGTTSRRNRRTDELRREDANETHT
ncbi:MAG: hypothetical protein ABI703_06480 [Gemmatimonadales bacterium]